jgi:hypothetical protein
MEPQMDLLSIPVPPSPILEQAVGYKNDRDVRYLSLWWEPCGDEVMVSDGFVTFTGNWSGYLAYVHHKKVYSCLRRYNLGSSDEPAEYHLVVDLQERKVYAARCAETEVILAEQWAMAQAEPALVSVEYLDDMLPELVEQTQPLPTMEEIMHLMNEDYKAVRAITQWLNKQP